MSGKVDFMSRDYSRIGEPLNLLEPGQRWFREQYRAFATPGGGAALVLGATPWLGQLCGEDHRVTFHVDRSGEMLGILRRSLAALGATRPGAAYELLQRDWLDLPSLPGPLDVVCGDNSLDFLPFPDGWRRLLSVVADRMRRGGILAMRVFQCPLDPRTATRRTTEVWLEEWSAREMLEPTALRAALMFSWIDPLTYGIDTEAVVRQYEEGEQKFVRFMERRGAGPDNDLATIRKYKGTGLVLYAPPLERTLALVSERFRVERVAYGDYAMADCFPLVLARRR